MFYPGPDYRYLAIERVEGLIKKLKKLNSEHFLVKLFSLDFDSINTDIKLMKIVDHYGTPEGCSYSYEAEQMHGLGEYEKDLKSTIKSFRQKKK